MLVFDENSPANIEVHKKKKNRFHLVFTFFLSRKAIYLLLGIYHISDNVSLSSFHSRVNRPRENICKFDIFNRSQRVEGEI